tara:strand:+ start:53 stop:535 length:483 start_codon:yes stop_codon:yes gene_type:complete
MKLRILIGDRASEVAETLGQHFTNNKDIDASLNDLKTFGYKRYRLMRLLNTVSACDTQNSTLNIPIEIEKDEVRHLVDQLNEDIWKNLAIEKTAIIWDHYLIDSNEYASWFGLDDDASEDIVDLAVQKCKVQENELLIPLCDSVFKLSRLNDNRYIEQFR